MSRGVPLAVAAGAVILLVACGAPGGGRGAVGDSAGARAGARPSRADSAVSPVLAAVPAPDSVGAHPVDWTVDLVLQRLASGGLSATPAGPVTARHMRVQGTRVVVPGAELEVYIYGDANAAAQDIDRFDRLMRTPDGALAWNKPPALVTSNNMVILIVAADAAVRQRVARVLRLSQLKEYRTGRSTP
jgi:hypothetical protein